VPFGLAASIATSFTPSVKEACLTKTF